MSDEKVIAVVGATGAQGGGLVRAILNDDSGQFSVRALTRNVDSDKAKALAALGAEVVAANVDDVDSLAAAFEGAHGVFCVTFFWDHFSPEVEGRQAGNMAEAARRKGVKHAVWSTLEDTRKFVPLDDDRMPTLMGQYKVPHFDSKGQSDHLFTDLGVPTTFLLTCAYWDNFINFGFGPQRGQDGKLALMFNMGDSKMPGIAAADIGACALGVFRKGSELIGKTVGIAGEHLTGDEMAAALSAALGLEIGYWDVPDEVYRKFEFDGAEDVANMFQFKREFEAEFCGARSLTVSRELHPGLQTLEQWLAANADQIPIPE